MNCFSLSHLGDHAVDHGLAAVVGRDCTTTAEMLAYLAEFDARKRYLPAAYPSMFAYCVRKLHMSEDIALKRIRAARTAYEFPAIFAAVADGRLTLNAVILLKPRLEPETADELLAAAVHKTRPEIERLLAQRFPRPDRPTRVAAIPEQLAARPVEGSVEADATQSVNLELAARPVAPAPRARVEALSPQRYALQVTIGEGTLTKLRYAQSLLSHQVAPGDVEVVLDRALEALIAQLEKRKFAATSRPRSGRGGSGRGRHIPAHVRRVVCERDQGQCTFTSETGERCPARELLELDHIDPVARGGQATVEGIRLRCRAHNQYEAERMFGAGFMENKRAAARSNAADRRMRRAQEEASASAAAEAHAPTEAQEQARDVMAGLMNLGVRADAARRAAEYSETLPVVTLEERIRAAIRYLRPKRVQNPIATASGVPSGASAG